MVVLALSLLLVPGLLPGCIFMKHIILALITVHKINNVENNKAFIGLTIAK
jgi:hypothetical protein